MAKLKKDYEKEAKGLGITLTGEETIPQLQALIEEHSEKIGDEGSDEGEDSDEGSSDDADTGEGRITPDEDDEAEAPASSQEEGDYLRKYQYKKVNNVATVGGKLTDPDKGSKAEKMKAHLLKQSRVRILVPVAKGEHHAVPMSVTLNGYRLDFPKNTYVELPDQVADIVMKSQAQTDTALRVSRIDGDKGKEEALG